MDKQNYENEFAQINKIIECQNTSSSKEALLLANYSKEKYPYLNNMAQFHNILGLINFKLSDLEKSILDFEKSINIDPNFYPGYYNLGLAYFNTSKLDKSYNFLIKSINIKKDYKLARDKIIELLSFYEPNFYTDNEIFNLDQKIKNVPLNIDFSKKIFDSEVVDYFIKCKKIVCKTLKNLSYNKFQIFRKKSIFLNCERHKKIFFKYNSIPKYCFECFKVVIESRNIYDLLKVSLLFDQITFFSNFNRKNMIDKKSKSDVFKSIIYCTSLDQVLVVEKKTNKILNKYFKNDFLVKSKRGCYEYEVKYPEYTKITKNKTELMNFPEKWLNNEKIFDQENTKDGLEKKIKVHNTIKGNSLHNFLIINNWVEDQKLYLDIK
tara:strand:- start:322 stop:1458 length:1137 start_codon:yes stop_codon:yes gene_type:complete